MQEGEHRELMIAAIAAEGVAHAALVEVDLEAARAAYARRRREVPRLVGARAAEELRPARRAAQGGGARRRARSRPSEVREALDGDPDAAGSPVASYVLAVAALILDDDDAVAPLADVMDPRGGAFERTATALRALAAGDAGAYAEAAVGRSRRTSPRARST